MQRKEEHDNNSLGPPAAAGLAALSSSHPLPSFPCLAVVERQLIMQLLDLKSLARIACSCHQLGAESLHPAAGRFLPGAEPGVASSPFILKAVDGSSMDHSAHRSPLVRQHVPFQVRLDNMDRLTPDDTTMILDRLLAKLGTIKKVVSLSVWESPDCMTEEQALSLLSAVRPSCASIWGVRRKSVWVREKVQRAIFSMPLLTDCCARLFAGQGRKPILHAPALALATCLQSLVLMISASDLAQTLVLSALPNLNKLCLYFSVDFDVGRLPVVHLRLPQLQTVELVVTENHNGLEDQDELKAKSPSPQQLRGLLEGLPGLRKLTFQKMHAMQTCVQTCLELGPKRLPALRELLLLAERLGSCCSDDVHRCLVAWSELDVIVTHDSPLEDVLRDSGMYALKPRGTEPKGQWSRVELSEHNRQVSVRLNERSAVEGSAVVVAR